MRGEPTASRRNSGKEKGGEPAPRGSLHGLVSERQLQPGLPFHPRDNPEGRRHSGLTLQKRKPGDSPQATHAGKWQSLPIGRLVLHTSHLHPRGLGW